MGRFRIRPDATGAAAALATVWHRPLVINIPRLPVKAGSGEYRSDHAQAGGLNGGSGAPNQRVAHVGHGSTGDADLGLFLDLRGRPPLQLEDAVPMIPPAGASVPVVAAAGGNGIRSLNADIRLVEVKSIATLLSTGGEPQPLQVELVKQGEAVVHVFERQIVGTDARAFVENPPHAVAALFPLLQGGRGAQEFRPGLAMAQNVNGLLLVVPGPLRGGE